MRLIGAVDLSQWFRGLTVAMEPCCLTHCLYLLSEGLRVLCLSLSVGLKVSNNELMTSVVCRALSNDS